MQTTTWPRFDEPLRRTLARNGFIAAVVGVALALIRHDPRVALPVAILALWPSLGGHYVELGFLNQLRPRVPAGRFPQIVARFLVWFAGGVLLYLCMAATARAVPIKALPLRLWWFGGLLFIGLELVVHAALAIRGLPSFYNGRG